MGRLRNGQLPESLLAPVPWAPDKRLAPTAVTDLAELSDRFRGEFGHDLIVNEGYRTFETQVAYKRRTKLPKSDPRHLGSAATPGTSVHGWGLAVDLGRLGGFDSDRYAWLTENTPTHRWHQPALYQRDGGHPEPWHWEHGGPNPSAADSTVTPTAEEDDMFDDDARRRLERVESMLGDALTKLRRHDLLFLYFSTPDHRPAVAQPAAGWWAIAPSEGVRAKQREVAGMLGLVVEGTSVRDWADVVGQILGVAPNGDVILDPEAFIEQRAWPFYAGGALVP
jgi:hypothetical protein